MAKRRESSEGQVAGSFLEEPIRIYTSARDFQILQVTK